MKFGSKKAIFGAIWGEFEGFGPCLGISHPTHPHLGKISQRKTFFFWQLPLTVISTKGPTLRVPFLSSIPRACAGWREATSRASTRLHLEYLDQEIEECSRLHSSFGVSPCFMVEILEEFCNAALHGGDTASECRGASNPGLISSHLDFLLVLLSLSLFTSISCCPN